MKSLRDFIEMHRDMTRGIASLTGGGQVAWKSRILATVWFFTAPRPYRLDFAGWTIWEARRLRHGSYVR